MENNNFYVLFQKLSTEEGRVIAVSRALVNRIEVNSENIEEAIKTSKKTGQFLDTSIIYGKGKKDNKKAYEWAMEGFKHRSLAKEKLDSEKAIKDAEWLEEEAASIIENDPEKANALYERAIKGLEKVGEFYLASKFCLLKGDAEGAEVYKSLDNLFVK